MAVYYLTKVLHASFHQNLEFFHLTAWLQSEVTEGIHELGFEILPFLLVVQTTMFIIKAEH